MTLAKVKLLLTRVAFMLSLNVAVTFVFVATAVAASAGLVAVIVGRVVSAVNDVVNSHT